VKTVYLCGPINACTDDQATGWREKVKQILGDRYQFLDPMRRDYRGIEADSVKDIVAGDLSDIKAADIVLALAHAPSWGTAMEIFHAHSTGKTVITVCDSARPSPWLVGHSTILFHFLGQAIEWLERCADQG
jgi:hypothetical protein